FFFTPPSPPDISTLSLHDALPICHDVLGDAAGLARRVLGRGRRRLLALRVGDEGAVARGPHARMIGKLQGLVDDDPPAVLLAVEDRKSTRLNSSHDQISYAVFCLK